LEQGSGEQAIQVTFVGDNYFRLGQRRHGGKRLIQPEVHGERGIYCPIRLDSVWSSAFTRQRGCAEAVPHCAGRDGTPNRARRGAPLTFGDSKFSLNSAVFPATMRVHFTAVGVQALACLAAGTEMEQSRLAGLNSNH
jgi:hypothetical protein